MPRMTQANSARIEGARVDEQGDRADNGDDRTDQRYIALAELCDERRQNKNGNDLRNGLERCECAEQVAVAENVLCVVCVAGAGNCLIEGQEHSEHEEHDEVLVGDAELDAHPERNVLAVLGLGFFLDALMTVLEADEQHDDGNDGVEDGNLNPWPAGCHPDG